jgi:uncharacterized protein (UPF0297 family)
MSRKSLSNNDISSAISECTLELYSTLDVKGYHSFTSIHEIAGALQEEVNEFWDEIRSNDHEKIIEELKDIATVCMFAVACIESKEVDW